MNSFVYMLKVKYHERLMRGNVKTDESKLPHISSPDWEYNTSSVFVQFQTPLISIQFDFIHSRNFDFSF